MVGYIGFKNYRELGGWVILCNFFIVGGMCVFWDLFFFCGIGDWFKVGWELDFDWFLGGCGGIWLFVEYREREGMCFVLIL